MLINALLLQAPALAETEAFLNIQGNGLVSPLTNDQRGAILTAVLDAVANVSGVMNVAIVSEQVSWSGRGVWFRYRMTFKQEGLDVSITQPVVA